MLTIYCIEEEYIILHRNGNTILFVKGGLMELVIGLLIPFLGTTLGAGMVFFMKKEINQKVEKVLLGFASGVMIAASIWSLLMPSINMAEEQGKVAWIPATVGLLIGILSLLACDKIMPKLNFKMSKQGTVGEKIKKTTMLVLAVTIHNIPEGMAVGVTFAGALLGNNNGWSNSISNRNWYTKFPRRSNNINATKGKWNV